MNLEIIMRGKIRSPLTYEGNKYKVIDKLKKELGTQKVFVDVFGGSGTVVANMDSEIRYYNELDKKVYDLIENLSLTHVLSIVESVRVFQEHFDLNNELKRKENYYRARYFYNNNKKTLNLFALSKNSFSNYIRFNSKGDFNSPCGKISCKDYKALRSKIKDFQEAMSGVNFKNLDYLNLVYEVIRENKNEKDILFYFDPPYLGTVATYNNAWGESENKTLLALCELLDKSGYKFAMSNVFTKNNLVFQEWAKKYNIIFFGNVYNNCNYQLKDKEKTEVLIKN